MPWSKLKARVKEFMVLPLRNRIDFHVTSYRHSHDEAEKAWVTVDGERVFTASFYQHQYAGAKRTRRGTLDRDGRGKLQRDPELPRSVTHAEQLEIHRPQQFGDALKEYLELPIEHALASDDPFIRALAMTDSRVGRRRLTASKPSLKEHSLIRLFYKLRSETLNSGKPTPPSPN